jgi:dTDP-4-dehydrorhamnose 3,5-epimerase
MDRAVSPAQIPDVVITQLKQIHDERGAVLHMLRSDAPGFTRFGECYFSEVRPGAVKAWKRHRLQTQNLAVPAGRIRLAVYDDRPSSESRLRLQVLELGRPDAYLRLTIPPGLWYGFACISASAALVVNCPDLPHDAAESESLAAEDAAIPFQWSPGRACA